MNNNKFEATVLRYMGVGMIGCALGANQFAWNPRIGLLYFAGIVWFTFGIVLK